MPRYPIDRSTNFIIEEESWQVVEYDHTSVPGTIYLSLTENKINLIYDDVENNIADIDKLAKYTLQLPEEKQIFSIGSTILPRFTLMKNGKPCTADFILLPDEDKLTRLVDGQLIARTAGEATIMVQLKDYPDIKIPMTIVIGDEEQQFDAYIEGPDSIRLARSAVYTLVGLQNIDGVVSFSIDGVARVQEVISNTSVKIAANEENKLGTAVLTAEYNGKTYQKEIKIVPLW